MKKRLLIELNHLRDAVPPEYVIDDYPVELMMPFRSCLDEEKGWSALGFEPDALGYRSLQSQGMLDVVFYHGDSGVAIASPSLSSGLKWRVLYPGDGVLCAKCFHSVLELIAIRYEIAVPGAEWVRQVLLDETPWVLAPEAELDWEEDVRDF